MKVVTPEILWHDREPIYSVDLQPLSGNFQRLASCGVDKIVRVRLGNQLHYDYVSAGHFMYVFFVCVFACSSCMLLSAIR